MSLKIELKMVAWNDSIGDTFALKYTGITERDLAFYIKGHPMPEDPTYNEHELFSDLKYGNDTWQLHPTISQAMIDWLEDMMEELV